MGTERPDRPGIDSGVRAVSDYDGIDPAVAMLATQLRHVGHVRSALLRIRQELEKRGEVHDLSKLSPEEFPGFSRINATARQHPYGSEEYRASIRAELPTVRRHQELNTHHPEAHSPLEAMGWLDIVEMVCDWWGANQAYGQTAWSATIAAQRSRWKWSESQWWLIGEVAAYLSAAESEAQP